MGSKGNLQLAIHHNKMVLQKEKNRIIMEMARSMMKAKHLPNEYWAKVVACAIYIFELSPHKECQG